MLYVTFAAIVCEFVGVRTWGQCSRVNRSLSGVNPRSARDSKGEWAAQESLRTREASQSGARFCLRSLLPSWTGSLFKGRVGMVTSLSGPLNQWMGGGRGFILWCPPQLSKLLHLEMLLPHSGVGRVYHGSLKANHERRGRTYHMDWWVDLEMVRPAKGLGTDATQRLYCWPHTVSNKTRQEKYPH